MKMRHYVLDGETYLSQLLWSNVLTVKVQCLWIASRFSALLHKEDGVFGSRQETTFEKDRIISCQGDSLQRNTVHLTK